MNFSPILRGEDSYVQVIVSGVTGRIYTDYQVADAVCDRYPQLRDLCPVRVSHFAIAAGMNLAPVRATITPGRMLHIFPVMPSYVVDYHVEQSRAVVRMRNSYSIYFDLTLNGELFNYAYISFARQLSTIKNRRFGASSLHYSPMLELWPNLGGGAVTRAACCVTFQPANMV